MPGNSATVELSRVLLDKAIETLRAKYGEDVDLSSDSAFKTSCLEVIEEGNGPGLCFRDPEEEGVADPWRVRMDEWASGERLPVKEVLVSGLVTPGTLKYYMKNMDVLYDEEDHLKVWREQQLQAYRLWVDGEADIFALSYAPVIEMQTHVAMNLRTLAAVVSDLDREMNGRRYYFWLDAVRTCCKRSEWDPLCLMPFYVFKTVRVCGACDKLWPILEERMHKLGELAMSTGEVWPADTVYRLLHDTDPDLFAGLSLSDCQASGDREADLSSVVLELSRLAQDSEREGLNPDTDVVDDAIFERARDKWNEWKEGVDDACLYSNTSIAAHCAVRLAKSLWLINHAKTQAVMMDCCPTGASDQVLVYDLIEMAPLLETDLTRLFVRNGSRRTAPVELSVSIAKGLECWYHFDEMGPHARCIELSGSSELRSAFIRLSDYIGLDWVSDTRRVLAVPGCLAAVEIR